jgi:anti-sigma B factor antagonist
MDPDRARVPAAVADERGSSAADVNMSTTSGQAQVEGRIPAYGLSGEAAGRRCTVGRKSREAAMGEAVMTTRRQADGAIIVDVRGTLDAATVDAVRTALQATLQQERPPVLVVDLTFVTFMDSLGIGALVTGYNAAREVGTRFVLRNPSEFVHRQLRVTGLADMFGLPEIHSPTQTYTA